MAGNIIKQIQIIKAYSHRKNQTKTGNGISNPAQQHADQHSFAATGVYTGIHYTLRRHDWDTRIKDFHLKRNINKRKQGFYEPYIRYNKI